MISSLRLSCQNPIIKGNIQLDGSKSISNRVLIIKALCGSSFDIKNVSTSDDSLIMQKLLIPNQSLLDAHHAGTTFRFLTAYYAIQEGTQVLTGSERMKQRPIGPLVDALNYLGANIEYLEKKDYPPLKIHSPSASWKSHIVLPAHVSSQFISALLLVAPCLPHGLSIDLEGEIVSKPYIEMTIALLRFFGIDVQWQGQKIHVPNQKYQGRDFYVEADWSAASYYFSIAALSEEAYLEILGLSQDSLQGDQEIKNICQAFGVEAWFEGEILKIKKSKDTHHIQTFEYDFVRVPDLAQTVAVMSAGLGCSGLMSGLQTLKIKETDRIAALQHELAKLNVFLHRLPSRFSKKTNAEYYIQEGKVTTGAEIPTIETYNDHRMAMSFAPLALLTPIIIMDPMVVSKSYPLFWRDLRSIGFEIEETKM